MLDCYSLIAAHWRFATLQGAVSSSEAIALHVVTDLLLLLIYAMLACLLVAATRSPQDDSAAIAPTRAVLLLGGGAYLLAVWNDGYPGWLPVIGLAAIALVFVERGLRFMQRSPLQWSTWVSRAGGAGDRATALPHGQRFNPLCDPLQDSETKLRFLLRNAPIATFTQDLELRCTWIHNPQLGFDESAVIGKRDTDFFPDTPETAYLIALKRRVLETGQTIHEEVPLRVGEAVIWYDMLMEPLYDADQKIIGLAAVATDLSDRKRAELAIKELNVALEQQNRDLEAMVQQRTAELQTLIDNLPDYIFVIERETMRMPFCNNLLARLTGAETREQVQGKTIFECFPPNYAAYFAQQNQQVFDSGETIRLQESLNLPLGTVHVDTYKIPLKRSDGEVYALIGTSRDVTELMEARQILANRTAQLEALNQELDSFSYSVSHDLRAPLRHINGFVDALRQQLDQLESLSVIENPHAYPLMTHYLQVIENSSHKMTHLINGLLSLSRIGRRPLNVQGVQIQQLVEQAIELVKNDFEGTEPPKFVVAELPTLQGDPALLQQVVTNLVSNAVKFSRDRHPPCIEVGCQSDGTIFVKDNGVGFRMEYADQLFGAFQRFHSQQEFEGSGIGLATVQRIIHRHGGKIWATSQPNQGATFYFHLPA